MHVSKLPILTLVTLLVAGAYAQRGAPIDPLHAFLRDQMHFSGGELADLQKGRPVARQMATRDPVDVNIFGAVRIAAPAEAFIRQLRDIDVLERSLGVMQVGKFSEPPRLADLADLTLESTDVDDLRHCRPADCDIQLPAGAIVRFGREVDWRAINPAPVANQVFRTVLFERLAAYRAGGLHQIGAYADRAQPISVADDFRLLAAPGDLPVDLPELTYYLRAYPRATLPGATDVFYWNKGEFGMKPTIRLNHLVTYPVPPDSSRAGLQYVIATSQIYSDHYFSATLELRSVVRDPAQPDRGFYLLYTTKSRVSGLTGFIGLLLRPMVRSRARSGMEHYLAITKQVVETSAGQGSRDASSEGTSARRPE